MAGQLDEVMTRLEVFTRLEDAALVRVARASADGRRELQALSRPTALLQTFGINEQGQQVSTFEVWQSKKGTFQSPLGPDANKVTVIWTEETLDRVKPRGLSSVFGAKAKGLKGFAVYRAYMDRLTSAIEAEDADAVVNVIAG